jgi:excisionase family DNA binding protein
MSDEKQVNDAATPSAQLLRAEEVARRLGVRRPRVYVLMEKAGLPAPIRLHGTSIRWISAEIDAWISSRPRATAGENGKQGFSRLPAEEAK